MSSWSILYRRDGRLLDPSGFRMSSLFEAAGVNPEPPRADQPLADRLSPNS